MKWIVLIAVVLIVLIFVITSLTYSTEVSVWKANLSFLNNCPLDGCKVYVWTNDSLTKVQVSTRDGLETIKRLATTKIASKDARDEEPNILRLKKAYDLHIKIVTLQGKSRVINGWANNGHYFSQRGRNAPNTGAWIASLAEKSRSKK